MPQAKQSVVFPERGFSPILILVAVLLLAAGGIFIYRAFFNSQSTEIVVSPSPESSQMAEVSPTASISASVKQLVKKSPIPTNSPSPSPSASTQNTSAVTSPTPTPSPSEAFNSGYSLEGSTGSVTMKVSSPTTGYAVYAILKKDGSVVTNQSDFEYIWWADDAWIIESRPFDGCTQGIQSPCPKDHNNINGRHAGNTKLYVKVLKKSENVFVAKQEFSVTVTEN